MQNPNSNPHYISSDWLKLHHVMQQFQSCYCKHAWLGYNQWLHLRFIFSQDKVGGRFTIQDSDINWKWHVLKKKKKLFCSLINCLILKLWYCVWEHSSCQPNTNLHCSNANVLIILTSCPRSQFWFNLDSPRVASVFPCFNDKCSKKKKKTRQEEL